MTKAYRVKQGGLTIHFAGKILKSGMIISDSRLKNHPHFEEIELPDTPSVVDAPKEEAKVEVAVKEEVGTIHENSPVIGAPLGAAQELPTVTAPVVLPVPPSDIEESPEQPKPDKIDKRKGSKTKS